MHIDIRTQIPIGVGLGSSSAYNTAAAGCLLRFFDPDFQPNDDGKLSEEVRSFLCICPVLTLYSNCTS